MARFVASLGRAQPCWVPGGQLSDPFTGLEGTGNRYKHVAKVMQVLAKLSRMDRFLPEREVSLFARIFGSADLTGIDALVTDRLAPLDKRDPHRRAQLKATLLACFDNQHSIARTAAEMGIHVNTAHQRLDSAAVVTGGWRDPIVAMELHVALRLDALHLL